MSGLLTADERLAQRSRQSSRASALLGGEDDAVGGHRGGDGQSHRGQGRVGARRASVRSSSGLSRPGSCFSRRSHPVRFLAMTTKDNNRMDLADALMGKVDEDGDLAWFVSPKSLRAMKAASSTLSTETPEAPSSQIPPKT